MAVHGHRERSEIGQISPKGAQHKAITRAAADLLQKAFLSKDLYIVVASVSNEHLAFTGHSETDWKVEHAWSAAFSPHLLEEEPLPDIGHSHGTGC